MTGLEFTLLDEIGIVLAFTFVGGFVATKLRLPPIVGFLLAGVAVGPHTPGFIAQEKIAREIWGYRRRPLDVRRGAAFLGP